MNGFSKILALMILSGAAITAEAQQADAAKPDSVVQKIPFEKLDTLAQTILGVKSKYRASNPGQIERLVSENPYGLIGLIETTKQYDDGSEAFVLTRYEDLPDSTGSPDGELQLHEKVSETVTLYDKMGNFMMTYFKPAVGSAKIDIQYTEVRDEGRHIRMYEVTIPNGMDYESYKLGLLQKHPTEAFKGLQKKSLVPK